MQCMHREKKMKKKEIKAVAGGSWLLALALGSGFLAWGSWLGLGIEIIEQFVRFTVRSDIRGPFDCTIS